MIRGAIAAGLDRVYTKIGHRKAPPANIGQETTAEQRVRLAKFIEQAMAVVKDPEGEHAKYVKWLSETMAPQEEKEITELEFLGRMVCGVCIRSYLMGQGKSGAPMFQENMTMAIELHRCVSRAPEEFPATIHFLGVYDFSEEGDDGQ